MNKEILKNDILKLCGTMTVSGFEYRATESLKELYGSDFDSIEADRVGNHLLIKRCGRENARKILIDAHFDEVGMLVSEVLEGGFLRIVNVGGIDPSIMQAADVVVYGKQSLRGVVISVPPHLRGDSDGKLPPVNKLMVDVGLGWSREELEEIVPVGTPVGYAPVYSCFGKEFMAGKSFDNKACGAIAARAVIDTPKEELAGDVYVCFSAREETAHSGGVAPACFAAEPDYAMVIDVNLGAAPDTPEKETVEIGKGPSIAYSASTDRALTKMTAELCRKGEIAHSICAAPTSTGTNAVAVNLVEEGIPVVDVGLPLRNMHTYNEVLCLEDCLSLYSLVRAFVCSGDICQRFGKEELF